MGKRGAEEQLIKPEGRSASDAQDEVDPGVRTQPLAPVAGREVRGMPKRKGLGSGLPSAPAPAAADPKPAFTGFSFGTPATGATSGFGFGSAPTLAPAPAAAAKPFAGFSFGTPSAAPAPGAAPKSFSGFTFGGPSASTPSTAVPAPAVPLSSAGFASSAPTISSSSTSFAPALVAAAFAPASFGAPAAAFSSTLVQSSSAPQASGFSSGSTASASQNGFGTGSIAPAETSAAPLANGSHHDTPFTQSEPPNEAEVQYWVSMRGLNLSTVSFLSNMIKEDPFVDLSDVFLQLEEQYIAHRKESALKVGWWPQQELGLSEETHGKAEEKETAPQSHTAMASMPAPPVAASWTLPKPSAAAPPATGGFVPNFASSSGSAPSPFSFGAKPAEPKAAESAKPAAVSKPGDGTHATERKTANQFVRDVLAEPESKTDAPASNPFSFSSSTPSSEKKPLFSFAPSGPINPPTPDSKTFTSSKDLEDPSPAKLGKFGPGGSQPQLSFGGAKSTPAQPPTPTGKPFSFGFGAASPAAPTSGFSFGSSAAASSSPGASTSGFSFGSSKPAPFSFATATKPAFGVQPASTSASTSAASGEEEAAEPSEPTVNLAGASGAGEEGEDTVFEQRVKLHRYVDNKWQVEGLGQLKLKKAKEGGKRRLLMRTDGGGHVVLNMALTASFNATDDGNTVKFLGFGLDGAGATYLLRVKTADVAKEVVEKLQNEVEEIKKG